jgi:RAS protein activator-like 1
LPYLHETLRIPIDTIFNDKKLIELDPDQLKNVSRSSRSGSTNKTIDTSVTQLTSYVLLATESIFSSVEHCPLILKQALKLLWDRVSVKFTDEDTRFIAVTGFIFLRFFVPAILSPKLFALRDEHADQRTERTLKLTAKVIQTIGNLQTVIDAKEQFMSPMVGILQNSVQQTKAYVTQLIDVAPPDSSATLPATPIIISPDEASGYLQHVTLTSGVLWKRVTSGGAVGSLLYRKRFFELTNVALTYYPTEKKTGVSYVLLVEF